MQFYIEKMQIHTVLPLLTSIFFSINIFSFHPYLIWRKTNRIKYFTGSYNWISLNTELKKKKKEVGFFNPGYKSSFQAYFCFRNCVGLWLRRSDIKTCLLLMECEPQCHLLGESLPACLPNVFAKCKESFVGVLPYPPTKQGLILILLFYFCFLPRVSVSESRDSVHVFKTIYLQHIEYYCLHQGGNQ